VHSLDVRKALTSGATTPGDDIWSFGGSPGIREYLGAAGSWATEVVGPA